jgi:hypothetical protein
MQGEEGGRLGDGAWGFLLPTTVWWKSQVDLGNTPSKGFIERVLPPTGVQSHRVEQEDQLLIKSRCHIQLRALVSPQ